MANETKTSKDQKKVLLAIGLGILAILALWWTFFGFGGGSKPQIAVGPPKRPTAAQPLPQNTPAPPTADVTNGPTADLLREIVYPGPIPTEADARRNVFAYYVPPTPTPPPPPPQPAAAPAPTPPMLLAALSPASVYARTADFSLDVTGDKFTQAVHITIDGRELPTRFKSPQQLSATVPASLIANPGQRQVIARSSDGKLYSNQLSLSVASPPTPNYLFVGVILKPRHIGDIAILQDKATKEILNEHLGDIISGHFRVTSISDREVVLTDTNLLIKHPLALSNETEKGFPSGRPNPRVVADDDEP